MIKDLNLVEIATDLLVIDYSIKNYFKFPRITTIADFRLETFVQLWENTGAGLSDIGGSAVTSQRTYVFVPMYPISEDCLVFFGATYAYSAPCSDIFMEDVKNKKVAGKSGWRRYQ